MQATNIKEVFEGMLMQYQFSIEHTRGAHFRDSANRKIWGSDLYKQYPNSANQGFGAFTNKVNDIASACLVGCLLLIEADKSLQAEAFKTISLHLKMPVHIWNDQPNRTKQDAINLLQDLIDKS